MQRVANSQAFSRAPAMRAFLMYITDHAILGRVEKLKEQTIGTEVLGRKPNYDPVDDNIVRVRAHELRQRLEKYFSSDGAAEPITITVPRGSYAPEFVPRKSLAVAEAPAPPAVELPTAAATKESKVSELRLTRNHWLALALMLLATAAVTMAVTRFAMRNDPRGASPVAGGAIRDFWGQFFEKPGEELKVVYADASFALWQDLNGKTLNLGDYLSHKYLNVPGDKLAEVAARRATSPADIGLSVHLASLTTEFGGQIDAQFARNADPEFFHHGNVVLIGSRRSNPWIEVYDPSLNFELDQDPKSGAPLFRNRSPQPHEAATYSIPAMLDAQGAEDKEFTSYGVLAVLKGCGSRGLIVLDEGLNMQATQALGDMLTDPQRLDTLLRSMGHKAGVAVAPFEALIQITSVPGGYDNPVVVAYRLRPAGSCAGD